MVHNLTKFVSHAALQDSRVQGELEARINPNIDYVEVSVAVNLCGMKLRLTKAEFAQWIMDCHEALIAEGESDE